MMKNGENDKRFSSQPRRNTASKAVGPAIEHASAGARHVICRSSSNWSVVSIGRSLQLVKARGREDDDRRSDEVQRKDPEA